MNIKELNDVGLVYLSDTDIFAGNEITKISLGKAYLNGSHNLSDVVEVWIKNNPWEYEINLIDYPDKETYYKSVIDQWIAARKAY